jgi:hypothetical protein
MSGISFAQGRRRPLDGLDPDAANLRLDFEVSTWPHASTRGRWKRLQAVHRTGQACRVKNALAAHVASEVGLFSSRFDVGQLAAAAFTGRADHQVLHFEYLLAAVTTAPNLRQGVHLIPADR